jgi:predicted oxidoreductase
MEEIALSESVTLSRIIYGLWRLTEDTDRSASHIIAKIDACLEQGITSFDQADIYGGYTSEALFGSALKQAPALRAQMEIITKCNIVAPAGIYADRRLKYYDSSSAHIQQSVDRSLREMAIEQIDVLLLHRPDPLMNAAETGAALDALVQSGKVKALGVSNFRPFDLALLQANMKNKLVCNQIEINLHNNAPLTNGDLSYLQREKIIPMAWSPLAGGEVFDNNNLRLADKLREMSQAYAVQPSSLAIAWLLKHPSQILPIMGSNRIDRIKMFSEALSVQLDRQSWYELYEAANGREVP